jgi:hypothetical protein
MAEKNKLFIRFSTNPNRAMELANHCQYFHQPRLLEEQVPDLYYRRYKEIYLPATSDFRQAPALIMDGSYTALSHAARREERIVLRGNRQGKGNDTTYEVWEIMRELSGHMMEQALERTGMKRLPCFEYYRRSFRGCVGGLNVTVTMDSMSDCPKEMKGSYLRVSPYGWADYSLDELRAGSSELLKAVKGADIVEMDCDYAAMLKRRYPRFPWTWVKKSTKRPTKSAA